MGLEWPAFFDKGESPKKNVEAAPKESLTRADSLQTEAEITAVFVAIG